MGGDVNGGFKSGQGRVQVKVALGNDSLLQVVDIVSREAVAGPVEDETEAAPGVGGEFEMAAVRIKGEIIIA